MEFATKIMHLLSVQKTNSHLILNFFGMEFKFKNKIEKFVGYEGEIEYKKYKNFGKCIIKKYRKDSECINWLNQELLQYYPNKKYLPVAQHEYKALEILSKHDLAPKPLELGFDYIVIEYGGRTLEAFNPLSENEYLRQAKQILQIFNELNFKHNDLLPRNILVSKNKLKIIDFTLAEFNHIILMDKLPNKRWAYPNDERILNYCNKER